MKKIFILLSVTALLFSCGSEPINTSLIGTWYNTDSSKVETLIFANDSELYYFDGLIRGHLTGGTEKHFYYQRYDSTLYVYADTIWRDGFVFQSDNFAYYTSYTLNDKLLTIDKFSFDGVRFRVASFTKEEDYKLLR